ncbi:hypothetical protein AB4161_20855 [Vibrio sp. 10N.286.51.E5]|uniref:hypothetical protein n=1 Tax=Vibrio sp. 10N.286.51.E5 TaxID=3229709 RepID=UPI003550CE75
MPKVEVLLSTLNNSIYNIVFNPEYNYVVVHQITQQGDIEEYKRHIALVSSELSISINYIQTKTVGLSKSRNIAMDNSTADFCIIADDDVIISSGFSNGDLFECYQSDLLSFGFVLGGKYKGELLSETNVSFRNSFSISSVSMCLSRRLIDSNLRFNESFGLGAQYPSGEEFIFVNHCISKGFVAKKIPVVICYHEKETSGENFHRNDNLIETKFRMMDMVKLRTGFVYSMLFLIKKMPFLLSEGKLVLCFRRYLNYYIGRLIKLC